MPQASIDIRARSSLLGMAKPRADLCIRKTVHESCWTCGTDRKAMLKDDLSGDFSNHTTRVLGEKRDVVLLLAFSGLLILFSCPLP